MKFFLTIDRDTVTALYLINFDPPQPLLSAAHPYTLDLTTPLYAPYKFELSAYKMTTQKYLVL